MWWEYEIKWKKRPWAGLLVLGVGKGRVMVCWTPGALLAKLTLLKLKTSTDLCPVDLDDVFSSRAKFLGLGVGMCKDHKGKTQKSQISKAREIICSFWVTYGCLFIL